MSGQISLNLNIHVKIIVRSDNFFCVIWTYRGITMVSCYFLFVGLIGYWKLPPLHDILKQCHNI